MSLTVVSFKSSIRMKSMQQGMGKSSRWICLNTFACSAGRADGLSLAGVERNSAEKSGNARNKARYLLKVDIVVMNLAFNLFAER